MKNKLLGLILLTCSIMAFAADTTDSKDGFAVITGHGDILPDGYVMSFLKWNNRFGETITSDSIVDGSFRLEVPVGEGIIVGSLDISNSTFTSGIHKLYLTAGAEVEIDAVDKYMFTWPVKSTVSEQSEYELFIDNTRDLWNDYQKRMAEFNKGKYSRNIDEYYNWRDSIRMLIYHKELNLLKTRPVGTVWLDKALDLAWVLRYDDTFSEELKNLYASLDDSIKDSPEGRAIHNYLFMDTQVKLGDKFPHTDLFDLDGNIHNFSEFKGKWCLVDFWRAGCSPCIRALPELRELKEKYKDSLELVSLSLDDEEQWHKMSKMLPLISHNWNERKEDYGLFARLRLNLYPTFLIVDPDGYIKGIWTGYSTGSLKSKVNSYLDPTS